MLITKLHLSMNEVLVFQSVHYNVVNGCHREFLRHILHSLKSVESLALLLASLCIHVFLVNYESNLEMNLLRVG